MEYCVDLPLGYSNCLSEETWAMMILIMVTAWGVFFVYMSSGEDDE